MIPLGRARQVVETLRRPTAVGELLRRCDEAIFFVLEVLDLPVVLVARDTVIDTPRAPASTAV